MPEALDGTSTDRESAALARRIRRFEPFDRIEPELLERIAGRSELLGIGLGESVGARGEERLFMVLSGLLAVLDQRVDGGERWVCQMVPGDLFIERAPGPSGELESELRSLAQSEIVALSVEAVAEIMASHAEELESLIQAIALKLRRMHVLVHLSRLFHVLEPGAVRELVDQAEWVALESGETLFRQGDLGDSAYVVINGRLRVVVPGVAGERTLNEVGRGETLGEMVLVSGEERSATVYAVRDTQLARISRKAFKAFVEEHPRALQPLLESALERLKRHSTPRGAAESVVTLAVVPASSEVVRQGVARKLGEALSRRDDALVLDRPFVEGALGRGTMERAQGGLASTRLVEWLNERESFHRYVVYEADPAWTPWTEKCLTQADHVLLVGDAGDRADLTPVEARYFSERDSGRTARSSLVLLHGSARPEGTEAWLRQRPVESQFHLSPSRAGDYSRLARMVTGRPLGLVLGGGGARAFAHLGVLRALEECGVPIDLVGGTSLGAIIASLAARGMTAAEALAECQKFFVGLLDPTLPVVALLAGRRISRQLESGCEGLAIEDLPLPFFCVSTNLTDAMEVVHRRGSLANALRCSISLPGVLPPVASDGKLHVDGALMNNLPIKALLDVGGGGSAIAVDVSPEVDLSGENLVHTRVSGWKALWTRLDPSRHELTVPTITSVIMRGSVVGSIQSARERRVDDLASLYLRPDVDGVKLLEFDRIEEIARIGYESTLEAVDRWWSEHASEVC